QSFHEPFFCERQIQRVTRKFRARAPVRRSAPRSSRGQAWPPMASAVSTGNSLMTSAMQHQRGCGPTRFGTEDQDAKPDRAAQCAGERARYLRTKPPRGSGACDPSFLRSRYSRRPNSAASIRAANTDNERHLRCDLVKATLPLQGNAKAID